MRREGLEPILGAAYLLTDRCWADLAGDRKRRLVVTLRSKTRLSAAGLRALETVFREELSAQKVRWAIAKNNLPIREHVTEQAVLLANGRLEQEAAAAPPTAPPAEELTDEQRKEIERLIAEVEEEVRALNQKKGADDPKNISASWEEKQEAKGEKP